MDYRKGVICIIKDKDKKILILNLKSYKNNEWNFLGGGVEENESEVDTVFRELKEELNIDKTDLEILYKSKQPLQYDFPKEVIEKGIKEGRKPYKGQIKTQFILFFSGQKSSIVLEDTINEIKWVEENELKNYLIFKDQYQNFVELIKEYKESI